MKHNHDTDRTSEKVINQFDSPFHAVEHAIRVARELAKKEDPSITNLAHEAYMQVKESADKK